MDPEAGIYESMEEPERTGTAITASAHIVTAVVGSGVLALPWSLSKLGWIPGVFTLLTFAAITYCSSLLLIQCYRSSCGDRRCTYISAVKSILGGRQEWLCGMAQYADLIIGGIIGSTITASQSMSFLCSGRNHFADQKEQQGRFVLIFGCAQLIFSQVPNFHKLSWLSLLATVMSFSYTFMSMGLSVNKAMDAHHHGSLFVTKPNVWNIFQAVGNIAFACAFSAILIEIQDTIKSPPSETQTMKKAASFSIILTTAFYIMLASAGYAAFGQEAPGNILTGFHRTWLVDCAHVCIIINLVGYYQVYAQPIFAAGEALATQKWPRMKRIYLRLTWRTLFVTLTTLTALAFPYFNQVLGLAGAITFWPMSVYFPIKMYMAQYGVNHSSWRGISLQLLSMICLGISVSAAIGSIYGIVNSSQHDKGINV